MNKVWLVVSGDYSDYQVHCGFANEDLAFSYAAAMNHITVDEQREVAKLADLPFPLYKHALAALPRHVQDVNNYGGYRVEGYDVYDHVPVVK